MAQTLNLDALESLSPEEKAYALRILQEMSEGKMESYNALVKSDYKEMPVDIETFMTDDNYLGQAWKDASGKSKLYPFWLEQLKKLFPNPFDTNYNTLLESGARGIGKAQPLDSMVLTVDGYRPMGEIKVGDKVYGEDGLPHEVISVFPQGQKRVYKITFSDDSQTECSDEHLWTVTDAGDHKHSPKTLTLNELLSLGILITKAQSNKKFRFQIPLTDPVQFKSEEVPIFPYTLGSVLQKNLTDINSEVLREELKKIGWGESVDSRFIPEKYLYNSIVNRIDLLQGILDNAKTKIVFSSITIIIKNEQLQKDIIWLVQSLGGTASLNDKSIIRIKLPKDVTPFRDSDKLSEFETSRVIAKRTIKSIKYIGKKECQCILLDSKRHLYLTDNFIVTHNSEVACGAVGAYLMYRVMCLKNPLEYYHLKATEKICFGFMNIKLALAEEIAISKFQKTIQASPWFMSKGTLTQRNNQPYWVPPEPINIIIGSQSDDVIGKPIFYCLSGDTLVCTADGDHKIEDMVGNPIRVHTFSNQGYVELSQECTVALTGEFTEEYEIILSNGAVVHCTPNHRFLTSEYGYVEAKDLTLEHKLVELDATNHISETTIASIVLNHLSEPKKFYDVINANPYNNFLIRTGDSCIISHNCFFDEISFIRNQDIEKQKKKAKDMIDTAIGGMYTRFIHKGKNPTMLVVASSKRSEQSFMEEYIRTLSANEANKVLVIDKPVWEVKPKGTYSSETFYVGLGNKFLESIVIPDSDVDKLDMYVQKGYKILEVPIDFKAKFLEDMDRNLCDFAGISSASSNKYMSAAIVGECINDTFRNPFPDIIEVGDGPDDTAQYKNFFALDLIPRELKSKPLFIHLDMSIARDMTGIAGVWITGKKVSEDPENQGKDLSFRLAFSTSVKAPKGHQVSFEKNRNFIRWLKQVGFNIKEITSDTFQSYDLQQQLKAEGFTCSILSVDRVDTDRVCKPYQFLKSAVYEKRFTMYKSKRLFEEFIDVERNLNSGKIDHTPNGHKDALDAVCGATFTASKYAEEYAFNYGESLDIVTQVSGAGSEANMRQQINIDFEEEMKRAFDPVRKKYDSVASPFLDFGLGEAKTVQPAFVSDNILIW